MDRCIAERRMCSDSQITTRWWRDERPLMLIVAACLQARRRDLAQRSVKRYEDLVASEFVSPVQVQNQQEMLIDQDGRLRTLERARLNLQRERGSLVSEQKQITADLATTQASMERELLALDQEATENTARRSTVVVAPQAGTVSAVAIGKVPLNQQVSDIKAELVAVRDQLSWSNLSADASLVQGAVLVGGSVSGDAGATALFDGAIVERLKLQSGSFIPLPGGSWSRAW